MVTFTQQHPLGAVATSSALNTPSVSALYVFPKDDFTFYFGTRTATQKFQDLQENPFASIALHDATTLETLQLRGKAEIIIDPSQVRVLLEELRGMFVKEKQKWMAPPDRAAHGVFHIDVSRWVPPVSQMREGSYVFFKVTPEWARFRHYDADWKEGKDYTEYEIKQ